MKLTESQLRKIVKEELKKTLKENHTPNEYEQMVLDILDDMRGEEITLGKLHKILFYKDIKMNIQQLKDLIINSPEDWMEFDNYGPASASDVITISDWGSDT